MRVRCPCVNSSCGNEAAVSWHVQLHSLALEGVAVPCISLLLNQQQDQALQQTIHNMHATL